jgi:hypothetical protein
VKTLVAVLYIVAVVLIVLAAVGVPARVSLALLGAATALLAYSLPVMQAGFNS